MPSSVSGAQAVAPSRKGSWCSRPLAQNGATPSSKDCFTMQAQPFAGRGRVRLTNLCPRWKQRRRRRRLAHGRLRRRGRRGHAAAGRPGRRWRAAWASQGNAVKNTGGLHALEPSSLLLPVQEQQRRRGIATASTKETEAPTGTGRQETRNTAQGLGLLRL